MQPEDELFLPGDCIDRGPDPVGVFDHIFCYWKADSRVYPLRGNHEQSLLRPLRRRTRVTIFTGMEARKRR
ncbi:MAG: metallophosphoesterase [Haliscomenobacter sp.]|nr:metallophosphoesterase [Haliscomenobacter sp.]